MPDTPQPPIPTPGEDTLVAHAEEPPEQPEPVEEEREAPTTVPPQEAPVNQLLPLAVALPQQTRRLREQVLPAWYARFYAPASGGDDVGAPRASSQDPAIAELIGAINGALSAADQAMMTQDVNLMRFAYRALESFK